ncbi:MAG: alpha/beta hydrolase [Planctomycetales bacterium]|nr:alpha/beta hydrolase [Planctomycetales bacterium]
MRKLLGALLVAGPALAAAAAPAQDAPKDEKKAPGEAGKPAEAAPAPAAQAVKVVRDIRYVEGEGADPEKHLLDLYVPEGKTGAPVLLFIHGGAWSIGDKKFHPNVGRAFASRGILTALASYRLSPSVKHPEHARDVARAIAWLVAHAAEHGGDPKRLVLSGHSAGGHLVTLVTLDPTYLAAHGLEPKAIRGVAAISGVYVIRPEGESWGDFPAVFGTDPEVRKKASPLTHVKGDHPPFLVLFAERDFLGLPAQARLLHAALEKAGSDSKLVEIPERGHIDEIFAVGRPGDPLTEEIAKFVGRVSLPKGDAGAAPVK